MFTKHTLTLRLIKAVVAIWLTVVLAPLAEANGKNQELITASVVSS